MHSSFAFYLAWTDAGMSVPRFEGGTRGDVDEVFTFILGKLNAINALDSIDHLLISHCVS